MFHVWGVAGDSDSVAFRVQTQFNENSKVQAVTSQLPELCHNLLVGFTEEKQNVFVLGDGADTKYSGLAQTAIRDGEYAGEEILRRAHGVESKPYNARSVAHVMPLGRNWAIFSAGKFVLTGLIPYWIRHAIDFYYFAHILSPRKLFSLFFEGWKYRS